jgi:para-aminobenzoate synthetase component I
VSIKKINFSPDFTALSAWGHNHVPFIALVDFDGNLQAAPLEKGQFSESLGVFQGRTEIGYGALHYRFNFASRLDSGIIPGRLPAGLEMRRTPEGGVIQNSIRRLQAELLDGYSYLVNYCSQTEVSLVNPVASVFRQSTAPFSLWLENRFLCFSPEAFVSVKGNEITTTPMKGTAYDAQALLDDEKEKAEHATVVDLLRNDLGRVARRIEIQGYRYLSEVPQADGKILYQTSSKICGTMPPDWRSHIGSWLPLLLPAGSVTGAPKKKTVELIRRYESEPRGFFTGIAALFDGQDFHSCVLIRYLDLATSTMKFRSGAGITIYSDPAAEYREILSKVYIPR